MKKEGNKMALIGIDLGTTTSLCCVYRDDHIELIPNALGSFFTPSVVCVKSKDEILVGESAKQALITEPQHTVRSFKKDMGTDKTYLLNQQVLTPVDCSSFIIKSLIEDARRYLKEDIDEVIISVPAYFHDEQRLATKRAAQLAGVKVERLINEPSAAALASYFDTTQEQLFCVFDFGGGTLDISLVDCFENVVEIQAVSGDNHCGGDNFHDIMVSSFLKEHQLTVNDKQNAILYKEAENCKKRLTNEKEATMTLTINQQQYISHYTNERLLHESASILNHIQQVLTQCLTAAKINASQVDQVVLAGGSSKMPIIQGFLEHLFHQKPYVIDDCDQLIVKGLGYVCGVKLREESIKDYVLSDICPFSLGIGVYNENEPNNSYFSPIIHRNTVLPCSRVNRFYTIRDDQEKLDIECYQGENIFVKNNLKLSKIEVPVPKNKKGKEAVDVRFTYDINGILEVDIQVVSTRQQFHKIVSQKMDEKELQAHLKQLEKLKIHPKDDEKNQLVLQQLQALFEQASYNERPQLEQAISYFEYVLNQQEPKMIEQTRKQMLQLIHSMDVYDPFASIWFDDDEGDGHSWIN